MQIGSNKIDVKVKAVPLQALNGPKCSRKLRFPDFMKTAQDGGKIVSFTHRLTLPPRKYTWQSFLLEAESTPVPQRDRKDYVTEKIPMTTSGIEPATCRFVVRSALTTTPPRAPIRLTLLYYMHRRFFMFFCKYWPDDGLLRPKLVVSSRIIVK